MPIEIRELVIRALIDPSDGCSGDRTTDPQSNSANNGAASPASGSANGLAGGGDRADLIRTCVEEVLRVLEDRRER